jgi:capsular exopolysaccharide synthesis family protein
MDARLVSLTAPHSFPAEQYQGLRIKLEYLRRASDMRVFAVTSPGAGDGKTLTSINLAGALARESDARVLLVDADLRRSRVAAALGVGGRNLPGLSDVVGRPNKHLAEVTLKPGAMSFAFLPAGSSAESVHRIVRSARLEQTIAEAREHYDFIVLDTPPLVPVFDAAVLSRAVDGVIVVVSAGRTPRRLLEAALEQLDARKVIGIVFNGDTGPLFGYSRSYYHSYFPARTSTT